MSRTVLVAGGAGAYRQPRLQGARRGRDMPVCYDTLEKGHQWAVRPGPLERGDIGDAVRLDEVFSRYRPSAVLHLAGYIEVGESVREPERYRHNNVTTSQVPIAALRHGVEPFVFSSSCAVYGLPQTDLLAESHPLAPISPYAELGAKNASVTSLGAG